MIPRDAEPIGHVTPRPRIDLYRPRPGDPNEGRCSVCGSRGMENYCARVECPPRTVALSQIECERIWGLVRGAAEASNIRTGGDTE